MSHDPPIPRQGPADGPVTLAWGAERPARPGRMDHLRRSLTDDRSLALVAAGLGAVAAFASLINEWTVTTVPDGPLGNSIRVPAGVAEADAFGTGYLVGLLVVLGSLSLVLFGTGAGRRNARVVGLAAAGTVFGLLAAAAVTLDEMAERRFFLGSNDGFRVEFGPGLTLGFAATLLLGAAVVLAGRAAARPGMPGRDEVGVTAAAADTGRAGAGSAAGWASPSRRHEDTDGDEPIDLTVSAAPPIVQPPRGYGDGWSTGGDPR